MKPGGTEGGEAAFFAGLGMVLTALGLYLLFDSVQVTSGGSGLMSRMIGGGGGFGVWETTSRGIIFAPLMLAVVLLFYNAKWKFAWGLLWVGFAIIVVEILSRLQFVFSMKTSHLILTLATTAAGIGLILRGLREDASKTKKEDQ